MKETVRMNGKELILTAISGGQTERTPWLPFCGVHSASLIGATAEEYLKSSDLMIKGLNKAIELYKPDGIPVIFDLQLEAEIFGCGLHWNKDNPPSVESHPLTEGKKLEDLRLPTEKDGRIPLVVETIRTLRKEHPDIALYGLITGPFTLALHLLGTDIFMQMYDDPAAINKVLDFCAETGKALSRIMIENGCDVIAVVDPMTSQIGPEQFEEFCTVPMRKIFDYIREKNAKGSLFVCGHAQKNIEVMCDVHCDNISIDENIPLDYVRDICRKKGVSFGGNMQLTVVMLLGDESANRINAVECLDIGGKSGFILSPGCDIPYAVPPCNIIAAGNVARSSYEQEIARELAKNTKGIQLEKLDLSNYLEGDKLKIDVVTLDSLGCAPCQYMVAALKAVLPEFGDKIVWKEHKVKEKSGIQMMVSLGVKNIPTLCIDGKIEFISIIPSQKDLAELIRRRLAAKGLL